MAQDIRKLFRNEAKSPQVKMPDGHRDRFFSRLDNELPKEKRSYGTWWYQIAAVLIVAIGVVAFLHFSDRFSLGGEGIVEGKAQQEEPASETSIGRESPASSLAEVSPEFKKLETYYLAYLNLGLSKLEITEENKSLVDTFMAQLGKLDREYDLLNAELQEHGFNGATLEALIQNLQLRLDLLYKLNQKLKELNKELNENFDRIQA